MFNFGFSRYGSTSPVVKNIIIICALMLLAKYVLYYRFGIDLDSSLGLYYFGSPNFHAYQLLSYMVMHGDFMHLFLNMFAFYMFGKVLESVWGSQRFLIYFLITGVGAALIQQLFNHIEFSLIYNKVVAYSNTPTVEAFEVFVAKNLQHPTSYVTQFMDAWRLDPKNPIYVNQSIEILQQYYREVINVPMVGASGAVFGVLLAFGMLFPNTELMLLFPPIPIKAKYFVIGYGAIELFQGVSQPGSNIAHFAHLGGMLFGYILIRYWNKQQSNFY